jgi:hypothetical protein
MLHSWNCARLAVLALCLSLGLALRLWQPKLLGHVGCLLASLLPGLCSYVLSAAVLCTGPGARLLLCAVAVHAWPAQEVCWPVLCWGTKQRLAVPDVLGAVVCGMHGGEQSLALQRAGSVAWFVLRCLGSYRWAQHAQRMSCGGTHKV